MRQFRFLVILAIVIAACKGSDNYTVQEVRLQSQTDSLNYLAGYFAGIRVKKNLFASDSTTTTVTNFVNALEAAYNNNEGDVDNFPLDEHAKESAKLIGRTIREQERESGLMGISGWETDFDRIKQGLINGLYFDTTYVHPDSAVIYLNRVIPRQ